MPIATYIVASEYTELTGRPVSEATDSRLLRASQLLDTRIGVRYTYDETTGRKLDLSTLSVARAGAVKSWVAWMVVAMYENADNPTINETVTLGRFSLQAQGSGARSPITLPDQVVWADEHLRDVGVIDRRVRVSGRGNDRWGGVL